MAVKISKPIRIAAEGKTVDGREISRQQIVQMAMGYNPEKYGARINNNHLLGITPDSIFAPKGDVLKLTAQEFDAEGVKKMGLYAVISALPSLVDYVNNGTTIYWSIELADDFAGTGEPYCMGLAMTDTPASLWTEIAKFSAAGKLEATRHVIPGTLFSIPLAADGTISWEPEDNPNIGEELLTKIKGLFSKQGMQQADISQAVEFMGKHISDSLKQCVSLSQFSSLQAKFDDLEKSAKIDQEAFAKLVEKLSKERDNAPNRPNAPGGGSATVTDC